MLGRGRLRLHRYVGAFFAHSYAQARVHVLVYFNGCLKTVLQVWTLGSWLRLLLLDFVLYRQLQLLNLFSPSRQWEQRTEEDDSQGCLLWIVLSPCRNPDMDPLGNGNHLRYQ